MLNSGDISMATTRNPFFTPDTIGDYKLRFSVMVGDEPRFKLDEKSGIAGLAPPTTASDTVTVKTTHKNLPPEVKAGKDQTVKLNEPVMLDGTGTFDPNGDELTYKWSFDSVPEGSLLKGADLEGRTFPGPTSKLKGATYYLFFAGMMLLAALVFIPVAMAYKPKEYLQDEAESSETESSTND